MWTIVAQAVSCRNETLCRQQSRLCITAAGLYAVMNTVAHLLHYVAALSKFR